MSVVSGIVLCGGASRRMGQDKAWLPIGGEAMLTRIARIVGMVCDPIIVVAGVRQSLPDLPGSIRVCRDAEEYQGPVAGLRIGLAAALDDRPTFVCGCDMPFVSAALIRLLAGEYRPGHAVVPVVGGVRQTLGAVYSRNMNLVSRSLQDSLASTPVIEVNEDRLREVDPGLRTFMQINDPQSYKDAVLEWERET